MSRVKKKIPKKKVKDQLVLSPLVFEGFENCSSPIK